MRNTSALHLTDNRDTGSPSPALGEASPKILVGCPDARPPAYEAVAGLARENLLGKFETSFYFERSHIPTGWSVCHLPDRLRIRLSCRSHPEIPEHAAISRPVVDLFLAAENRCANSSQRRTLARWRTHYFDQCLQRTVKKLHPSGVLLFSDVGSGRTLPYCQQNGIPSIVSVVHGDPAEEMSLLEHEAIRSPEYFPIYLGDGEIDVKELTWLHERRKADRRLASLVLVPSQHIADRMVAQGVPEHKIRVIPYAADVNRFYPRELDETRAGCRFLFAGGITQRKGIGYLLAAWRMIRRSGWTLELVGALPRKLGPLAQDLDQEGVILRGRVGHGEMPALMKKSDVFVFPSLFEGSAVVTYEALAAGLPCVVTKEAGSVVRHNIEGLIVPLANTEATAKAMEELGVDQERRAAISLAARRRGLEYDWPRYRESVADAVRSVLGPCASSGSHTHLLPSAKG